MSLVCFTLSIQSAVGLIWIETTASWLAHGTTPMLSLRSVITVLALVALGLMSSLAHLAKPGLAPQALRNLSVSWLSREVLLVQMFAGVAVLIIPVTLLKLSTVQIVLAITACLLAAMALFAMIRVYLLRTVPFWNAPATPLEFVGSTLLLGSAVAAVLISLQSDQPPWSPAMVTAGIGIFSGLVLKTIAFPLALSAQKTGDHQTWYRLPAPQFKTGRVWAFRMGSYLIGLIILLAAMGGGKLSWMITCLSLLCFVIGETLGRHHFYRVYRRIGL